MSDAPPPIAAREPDTHKGDYGRVLIIGGSQGMAGAVALAGMAALRGGAGLVTVATAESVAAIVATFNPCYMTLALPDDDGGRIKSSSDRFRDHLQNADAVAIGPGLGQSPDLAELVAELWTTIEAPLVLDADALNVLAENDTPRKHTPAGPRLLTPHPGEFRRLIDSSETERASLESLAEAYAADSHSVILLKGHQTLISDGSRAAHNATGNAGMATGGAGDVLTGLIAALAAAKHVDPFTAARQAAHVHGLAGDLAAADLGETSLTALDICEALPEAFQKFVG